MGIAKHTGIGCAAGEVFIHKIVDHVIAKLAADVDDVMWKPQLNRYLARIVNGVEAAAACFFFSAAGVGVIPRFHGNSHQLIALPVQQNSSYGAVNATAHRDEYFSL